MSDEGNDWILQVSHDKFVHYTYNGLTENACKAILRIHGTDIEFDYDPSPENPSENPDFKIFSTSERWAYRFVHKVSGGFPDDWKVGEFTTKEQTIEAAKRRAARMHGRETKRQFLLACENVDEV